MAFEEPRALAKHDSAQQQAVGRSPEEPAWYSPIADLEQQAVTLYLLHRLMRSTDLDALFDALFDALYGPCALRTMRSTDL